jgi:hypothetical protein
MTFCARLALYRGEVIPLGLLSMVVPADAVPGYVRRFSTKRSGRLRSALEFGSVAPLSALAHRERS